MKDADTTAGDALLATIAEHARATAHLTGRMRLDPRVLAALRRVRRAAFVPDDLQRYADDDCALPIGYGQTISQPFIVALMCDLIHPREDAVVLEIGTGSGYQAAILAELVRQVYSLEIVDELAQTARTRLRRLGYTNVDIATGDGHQGWPQHAPYAAIVVAAAPLAIPPPLIEQLKPGGTLVIPLGARACGQDLMLVSKDAQGRVAQRALLPVAFVPFTGGPCADPAGGAGD